jgi:hypothetical protein
VGFAACTGRAGKEWVLCCGGRAGGRGMMMGTEKHMHAWVLLLLPTYTTITFRPVQAGRQLSYSYSPKRLNPTVDREGRTEVVLGRSTVGRNRGRQNHGRGARTTAWQPRFGAALRWYPFLSCVECCYRATHGLAASSSPSCMRSVPVRQNALFDLALLQLYMNVHARFVIPAFGSN